MHTAPYFTAIGFLTIVHAARVIRLRNKLRVGLGAGGHPELEKAIRVFGNHAEYAPLALVLLAALEFVQAPIWYMHLTGGMLVVGRCLHAIGLSKTRGVSVGRVAGTTLTLLSVFLGSIGVTLFSMMPR